MSLLKCAVRACGCLLLGVAVLAITGCGAQSGDVAGKVTYKGKPVVFGTVTFIGSDGTQQTGPIGPDGSYRVNGVKVGTAKVAVASPDPTKTFAQIKKMQRSTDAAQNLQPFEVDQKKWFPIPDALADPDKSSVTYDVRGGANDHDIALK